MTTFIISGGQLDLTFAGEVLCKEEEVTVIAADRGAEACAKLRITPDYIIGDFDSISEEGKEFLANYHGNMVTLHPVKDDTDTEAALHLAFDKTEGDIVILGGIGTRLDHVIGNISILRQGITKNRKVILLDAYNRIQVVSDCLTIDRETQFGKYVSIFPMGGVAKGVRLQGFYYPLEDATLVGDSSLGVSNEIVEEKGEISVREGCLLVIESRDEK